jgi:hypothetical protein
MERNRLGSAEPEIIRLPRPITPPLNPAHFMLCAVPCDPAAQGCWQLELYRWAYAQAQAVATPSIVERDLLGVWN